MCLYQDVCACVHVRALWTSTYRSLCDLSTARKKKISVSMMQGKTPTTWRWLWEYYCPSKILFLNWSVSLQWLHHTKTQKVHTLCVTQDHQRKSLNYIYWTECKQIRNYPSPATVDSSWQTGPTTTKQKRRYFFHNFTVRAIFKKFIFYAFFKLQLICFTLKCRWTDLWKKERLSLKKSPKLNDGDL